MFGDTIVNYNALRDQWTRVALEMEEVADTFRADKSPNETASALNSLGDELKILSTIIMEQYK